MEEAPNDPAAAFEFLSAEILHGTEFTPETSRQIVGSLNRCHEHFFGPFTTYFVLGSYERPFKFRLDTVVDELNRRVAAYAFLQATQPDLELPDGIPALKLKFYVHALYADAVVTVLEHDTGGALVEFGRLDRTPFFDRTFVFPRGLEARHESWKHVDGVRACAIELAYRCDDVGELGSRLEQLASHAQREGIEVTPDGLMAHLEDTFGAHLPPSYSELIPDVVSQYEAAGRYASWTTENELRDAVSRIPI